MGDGHSFRNADNVKSAAIKALHCHLDDLKIEIPGTKLSNEPTRHSFFASP